MELLFDEQSWVKWLWEEAELEVIKQGLKLGYNVHQIAKSIDEDTDNVALAIMHLSTKGTKGHFEN